MAPIDAPDGGRKRPYVANVKESYPEGRDGSSAANRGDGWPGDEALAGDEGVHARLWGPWSDEFEFGIGAEGGAG